MTADLTPYYQEIVDIISSYNENDWNSFRLEVTAEPDEDEDEEDDLTLVLTFIFDDHEEDSEAMTIEVFDAIEAIRAATAPEHLWSEWVFHFHRDGRYDIAVKYPDDAGTDGNG